MKFAAWLAAAALTFAPAAALAVPPSFSPSVSATSQVSCTSSIGVLVAAQAGLSHIFTIEQGSATVPVYIGGSAVTTDNGFLIPAVQYSSYTISFAGPLYCVTASSSATIYVIETVQAAS